MKLKIRPKGRAEVGQQEVISDGFSFLCDVEGEPSPESPHGGGRFEKSGECSTYLVLCLMFKKRYFGLPWWPSG